jgi:hypothetical protein
VPFDHRRFAAAPRFDHHRRRRAEHQALPGFEHVVGEVAGARHPDPPAHDGQHAGTMIDAQRRTVVKPDDFGTICIELRFHHQSPAEPTNMAGMSLNIRRFSRLDPMKSRACLDADLV